MNGSCFKKVIFKYIPKIEFYNNFFSIIHDGNHTSIFKYMKKINGLFKKIILKHIREEYFLNMGLLIFKKEIKCQKKSTAKYETPQNAKKIF